MALPDLVIPCPDCNGTGNAVPKSEYGSVNISGGCKGCNGVGRILTADGKKVMEVVELKGTGVRSM
jgi:DnaJ-class molecular chaperone